MAINAYFSFSGMITFKNWMMTDRLTACRPIACWSRRTRLSRSGAAIAATQ